MRRKTLGWLVMLGFVVSACGEPKVEDTTEVVRVEVSPAEADLEVDETRPLEARAFDGRGNRVRGVSFAFSSSAIDVATVDAKGVVRALRPGAAVITAAVGSKRATMEVRVRAPVHSISIEPNPVEMETGDSVQLTAIAYDENGNRIEGQRFEWSVANDRVATVDAEGVLTAKRREDHTVVWAKAGGVEGEATVIVRKKVDSIEIQPSSPLIREKEELQLKAVLRDDGGAILEGREVAWSTADENIATVDEQGVLRGVAAGVVEIAARHGEVEATASVEVRPERVHRLEIEPAEVELVVGESQQFTVRAYNAANEELFGRPLIWTVHDRDKADQTYARLTAEVEENGLLTALRPLNGELRVSVPGDGVSASAGLRIVLRMEAVSAGQFHTCALTAGGDAWCWGRSADGQAGRPPSGETIPAPVETELRFRVIAAGASHTCGLTELGDAYCWGTNDYGQLGNGVMEPSSFEPVQVLRPVDAAPFAKIYAGDSYSCALDTEGTAYCWGMNREGRLGNGFAGLEESSAIPRRVLGEIVDGVGEVPITFRELALGSNPSSEPQKTFTCGISTENVTYCWGENENPGHGIGLGEPEAFPSPKRVAGEQVFETISVGARHACGLTAEGEAYCWGRGSWGELGDGFGSENWRDGLNHSSPVPQPVDTDARYKFIGTAKESNCALTFEGEIHCWGSTSYDQANWLVPTPLAEAGTWVFESLSAGAFHFCGIDAENVVSCWGSNFDQQLGSPDHGNVVERPVRLFPE